jgi:hypothetical protein
MSSTLFQHAESFYNALYERTTVETLGNGVEARVFRGRVSVIFRSLGISQTFYGRVKAGLVESGCISFARVGSRGQDSEIVCHHKPEETEFMRRSNRPLTRSLENAILTQRLNGIESQLGGMNVVEALAEFEDRLRKLDSRIEQVEHAARQPNTNKEIDPNV